MTSKKIHSIKKISESLLLRCLGVIIMMGGLIWISLVVSNKIFFNPEQMQFADCGYTLNQGPQMVIIPSGGFEMGSPETEAGRTIDEGPVHPVTINSFAIGRCEVTFDEYIAFTQDTNRALPDDSGWGRGNHPVINVSWEDARAYTRWLSSKTGKRYRLPSEAEWEYVARAGTDTQYWWGNEVESNRVNCNGCDSVWGGISPAPVGTFPANAFGVYDTMGNVWEWVEDCWHADYTKAPVDGEVWLESNGGDCRLRVVRGGSWVSEPVDGRSARRIKYPLEDTFKFLGFRIAEDLD